VRKTFLLLIFFPLFALTFFLLFPKNVAAACTATVNPLSVPLGYGKNNNEAIELTNGCFSGDLQYRAAALPSDKRIQDVYSNAGGVAFRPVEARDISPSDETTLSARMNFDDHFSGTTPVKIPKTIGAWKIIVCLSTTPLTDCDFPENIVAEGNFTFTPPASTPTPTPQQDQPSILRTDQDQCIFWADPSADPENNIVFRVKNVDPINSRYEWWMEWNDNPQDALLILADPQPTSSAPQPTAGAGTPTPIPVPIYTLELSKNQVVPEPDEKPMREKGHLLCVDIEGQKRTGDNCQRLFFTLNPPTGNTACSEANSGAISPTPHAPLPPCAEWAFLNGTPVPEEQSQNEYIRDNNLRNGIKCISVETGIGGIATQPQEFVRFIFNLVLGIAGGIALILIIISGYRLIVSQGNPEAFKEAWGMLASTIVGLLFIIFAFVILQVVGVDLLGIPGFAK
jgi:hypothetical protein